MFRAKLKRKNYSRFKISDSSQSQKDLNIFWKRSWKLNTLAIFQEYNQLSSARKKGRRRTDCGMQDFITGTVEIIKDFVKLLSSIAQMILKILPDTLEIQKLQKILKNMLQYSLKTLKSLLMPKKFAKIWRKQIKLYNSRKRHHISLDKKYKLMKIPLMICSFINKHKNQSILQKRVTFFFYALQIRLDMVNGEKFNKLSEEI